MGALRRGPCLAPRGKLQQAAAQLEQTVEADPHSFWPHFSLGVCLFRLGRYAEAVHSFGVCVALAPDKPECYYNCGLAHAALDQDKKARCDYNRALRLDPSLAAACTTGACSPPRRPLWSGRGRPEAGLDERFGDGPGLLWPGAGPVEAEEAAGSAGKPRSRPATSTRHAAARALRDEIAAGR